MKKEKITIRKNSQKFKILKNLAAGTGIIVLSTISPQSGAKIIQELIKGYFRKKYFERQRFLNDLKNLQERQLIAWKELPNNEVEIKITRKGKGVMLRYHMDTIALQKPEIWDKEWRLIMFDIPHTQKQARDAFRGKLRDLKFHQLQKSVFITPYPCEDEIDFIGQIFEVRRHVLILYTKHFEGEEKLQHKFGL